MKTLVAVLVVAALFAPRLAAKQMNWGIPASDGELTPEVRAIVAHGDALTGARRYAAAEQEYRRAAAIVRRQGHLPSFTLWHLACAFYYEGNPRSAAAVLDQLIGEAQRSGELAVEALALYNSAWLSGRSGDGRVAAAKLDGVRTLLHSPYMPASIREQLGTRLAEPSTVAVER